MRVTHTIDETRQAIDRTRKSGFVPTMGFLHEGHISLIDVARDAGAEFIVVSIFVNPLQFGPNEDFERYPRNEERDRELLENAGVDLLFLPSVDVMYPKGATTKISVGAVSMPLEGERRPGPFDGVATVVMKLFDIVQPDVAAFGRKDAQQCAVIERMVHDLDVPVTLVFGETVREADGLAKSSRNSYLSADDRAKAPVLHRALRAGQDALASKNVSSVEAAMRNAASVDGVEIDYLALVDPLTFEAPVDFDRELLFAGAVKVGKTRLIDNIRVLRGQ
ncbi:MAG TPA: pantoate--beta-alanine ligase [Thermoanaerobaculia bacterium]|nr:pantoate--beta-alanine ligase [Thermoanaerobaculia bacterium]